MEERRRIDFRSRRLPWVGISKDIRRAKSARQALKMAELDWKVIRKPVSLYEDGSLIKGYYANIRETDGETLGIVSGKYALMQNEEAFSFLDELATEGVSFEMAGTFRGGRCVWIIAKFPENYKFLGDKVDPYIIFINSHDGNGGVRTCMTPIRVTCSNMINATISSATRLWSARHTGDVKYKLENAAATYFYANEYMKSLNQDAEKLWKVKLNDQKVDHMVKLLLPITTDMGEQKLKNIKMRREDLWERYLEAPDLKGMEKNGYRFVNAVSDFATHLEPIRRTPMSDENLLSRNVGGIQILDAARELVLSI